MVIQPSYFTPPMAPAIYYLNSIVPPEIKITYMFSGAVPYITLQLIGIGVLMAFSQIALWLPDIMIGFNQ